MRILILSFYFPPDQTPGAFRVNELVKALRKELSPESSIDVLTTMPNRYKSFLKPSKKIEKDGNLTVFRAEIPGHDSGFFDQSMAFLSFAREVFRLTKDKEYDFIFSSTSRLMTGALGALITRKRNIPFYLDIRDIFTDTFQNIFPTIVVFFVKPCLNLIEKFTVESANRINLISKGFFVYFNKKYNISCFSNFTNGIDSEFLELYSVKNLSSKSSQKKARKILKVLYAGNIGLGQGLERIIPEIAMKMENQLEFKIFGSGGRVRALKNRINKQNIKNVEVFDPIDRKELIDEYLNSDILFLHLNDFEAFKKVLPSKIFEYAATGKPIWAGLGGFSANFLQEEVPNTAVFPSSNSDKAIEVLRDLKLGVVAREDFIERFSRKAISSRFARDLISLSQDFSKSVKQNNR